MDCAVPFLMAYQSLPRMSERMTLFTFSFVQSESTSTSSRSASTGSPSRGVTTMAPYTPRCSCKPVWE